MFELIYTSGIVILLIVSLVLEWTRPVYLMLAALVALVIGGIIPVGEAVSGFANQGMLTVGVLYIIAVTLQNSGLFSGTVEKLLGNNRGNKLYLRLLFPVAFLSAFLNNTPLVASLIPFLKRWSRKNRFPVSKLMIPVSYAAILGGMCTLIGTSTNLVVHGMLLDFGQKGFSFFEIGKAGLPVAILSLLYFALFGNRFLPVRKDMFNQLSETTREFVSEVKVSDTCPDIGKTIQEAHLRHLKGLYLFQIVRNNVELTPLPPEEKLLSGDRLFFTGLPETIYDLVTTPGYELIKDPEFDLRNIDSDKHRTYEAVISNSSPLIGNTVRDSGFRTHYNAVILAIHRNGQRINNKVGDITFQPNDTLFLLTSKDFESKWYHSDDFSLISESVKEYSKPRKKGNIAFLLVGLMVISVATGLVSSMLLAAAIVAGLMLALRIISYRDAKNAVDPDVLLIIVAALGIGKAIDNSGIGTLLAGWFIHALQPLGTLAFIAGIFFITSLFTEIITNNAAAALLFPFVFSAANQMHMPIHPLMIVLAIAASSSFSTPFGYQTNLMALSAGGYRFSDFLRTGIAMNLLVGILTSLIVYLLYF